MWSVPTELPAADRLRWLAELADTLNQAHHLLIGLDLHEQSRAEAHELYLRIEAARFEVQSLRLSRSVNPRENESPEWAEFIPWPSGNSYPV